MILRMFGARPVAWLSRWFLAAVMASVPLAAAAPMETARVTVVIENVRSASGTLHVGLWDEAGRFTEADDRVAGTDAPAKDGTNRFVLKDLTPGRYALIAFHDENDNGEFDRTMIGLPAEGLGFSNGAWISVLGAPSFEEAAFEVTQEPDPIVIPLRY